jgi:capping protein beta
MADPLDCALDLMRRLPPSQTEQNLTGLIDLVPDLVEDLLSAVDQPLKVAHDKSAKRDYLLCDYNRDGNSYRSPWSNKYDPPLRDGAEPSPKVIFCIFFCFDLLIFFGLICSSDILLLL